MGLAIVGYAGGRLVTHQMVDMHRATAEILVNQESSSSIEPCSLTRGGSRSFSYYNDEVQTNFASCVPTTWWVAPSIKLTTTWTITVGRIKESPLPDSQPSRSEVRPEGFSPEHGGTAIDLFVLDAQRCRIVLNATDSEDDQIRGWKRGLASPYPNTVSTSWCASTKTWPSTRGASKQRLLSTSASA